jgi:hypothetical protein
MSWVEVKHALNSTVGTDNFESLDKIFKGRWRLAISEDAYLTTPITVKETTTSREYEIDKKIKFNADGRVNFAVDVGVRYVSAPTNRILTFKVYEDGELLASADRTVTGTIDSVVARVAVDVKKNKTYSFRTYFNTSINSHSGNKLSVEASPVYCENLVEVI